MRKQSSRLRTAAAAGSLLLYGFQSLALSQDLVAVSSLTGGTSVFVFRNSGPRRAAPTARPARTQAQRLASVAKIKRQYETVAKAPRHNVLEPAKIPKNYKTLPAAEGSKILSGVGEYYLAKNDLDNAMPFYRDAIALDENNTAAKEGLAEALARQGNQMLVDQKTDTAKAVFLEALKYDPQNAGANFGLGEVYSASNQPDQAIASYETSLKNNAKLTEIFLPLGILYFQAGNIAKADEMLTKALETSSESAETQYFLGLVRQAQNNDTDALKAFRKAESLDKTYAEAFYGSGEVLSRQKDFDAAIADYKQATALKPQYFDAFVGLAEALLEKKDYPEAIKAYEAAKKIKNDQWAVYAGLADAYRLSNDFANAAANYNLAILFYGRQADKNQTVLADLYSKQGFALGQQCAIQTAKLIRCSFDGSIQALKSSADITKNPVDYVNLGWAYFQIAHPLAEQKQLAQATPYLNQAKDALMNAVNADATVADYAYQNLAAVEIDLGDQKGAIESLQRLIAEHPDQNFMRYQLGVAYFKDKNLESAEKAFRDAIDRDPNYVAAMVGLGETLLLRKNGKELHKLIDRLRPLDANEAAKFEAKAKILRL